MAQAQVYCLADYMLLPNLQALAFTNMRTTFNVVSDLKFESRSDSPALGSLLPFIN